MANDVVKLGISADGKAITYKDLDATVVVSSSGETAESHMTNGTKHVPVTSTTNNGKFLGTLPDGTTGWVAPTAAYTKTETDSKDATILASAKTYADQKITALVNGAPGTLDTLKEIADELATNKTTVDAVNAAIGNKQDKITAAGMLKRDAATGNVLGATAGTDYVVPTGNVATADKLKTPRTIGTSGAATGTATNFDGSANITIPITALDATKLNIAATGIMKRNADGTFTSAVSGTDYLAPNGNSATATKMQTARAFSITGGATAAAINYDGSANVALTVTSLDATKLTGPVPDASVKKQVCFVATEAEIATQNLMAGGLVLMKVR